MTKLAFTVAGSLAVLVGIGWLGLQIKPEPFPPRPQRTGQLDTVGMPDGLPEPVERHFRTVFGERVPEIETAVVRARADFKVKGLWTPMRFESYHAAGRAFVKDMQITWFRLPALRGSDSYIDDSGSLKISGLVNMSETGMRMDQGENLAMWGEAPFTTPSVLVLDPRVRWEPVDADSARLIVPFGEREETLRVEFDPDTGLMSSMSGMRYQEQERTKTPWRAEYSRWETVHGIKVPHRNTAMWEDEGEPYIVLDLDGVEYNVDVSEEIP